MITRQELSEQTGFDLGEQFTSEAQVREYFTAENMIAMFGDDNAETDAETLDSYAYAVIRTRWHCAF